MANKRIVIEVKPNLEIGKPDRIETQAEGFDNPLGVVTILQNSQSAFLRDMHEAVARAKAEAVRAQIQAGPIATLGPGGRRQ